MECISLTAFLTYVLRDVTFSGSLDKKNNIQNLQCSLYIGCNSNVLSVTFYESTMDMMASEMKCEMISTILDHSSKGVKKLPFLSLYI